jgi:hypothetical protein
VVLNPVELIAGVLDVVRHSQISPAVHISERVIRVSYRRAKGVTSIYGKSPTEVVNQGGVAGFCFHHQPVSFPFPFPCERPCPLRPVVPPDVDNLLLRRR